MKIQHTIYLFLILITQTACTAQTNNTTTTTNFKIPEEFTQRQPDKSLDQILSVQYKDQMRISVSDGMDQQIKSGPYNGSLPMKQYFETKFPMVKMNARGVNATEQEHYLVNGHIYLHRMFEFNAHGTTGYYEYGVMYIEEPENYYEFVISGELKYRKAHEPLIQAFLEGVR